MKNTTILLLFTVILWSCENSNNRDTQIQVNEQLQSEIESLKAQLAGNESATKNEIATFLTFQNNKAEEAMNFYVSLFENSKVLDVKRWGKEMPSQEGKIMHATFSLNGSLFMCSDSPPIHDWDFSPAVSNFINCENQSELERLFSKLTENGEVTMPLNNYGFSKQFGWVIDPFGISWQLNLE